MSLVAIFDQAADQIREAVSNDVWDFQVEPWAITSPTPPAIDIYYGGRADVQDAANMGSTVEEMAEGFVMVVRGRVGTNDYEGNQDVLYALSDATDDHSIVSALYADASLNGHAQDLALISDTGLSHVASLNGEVHYGNVWRFLVIPAWS